MKYTDCLINGNHLQCEQYYPDNKIGMKIWLIIMISFNLAMLIFCCMLLPLAISTDLARSAYCFEIKMARRFKKFSFKINVKEFKMIGGFIRVAYQVPGSR